MYVILHVTPPLPAQVGALTLTMDGKADPRDGELTQFGEILASLPVDVKIGKLLILGHVFGLLEDCLIIGEFNKY